MIVNDVKSYDVGATEAAESSGKVQTNEQSDRSITTVGNEKFRCVEVPCQPDLVGEQVSAQRRDLEVLLTVLLRGAARITIRSF